MDIAEKVALALSTLREQANHPNSQSLTPSLASIYAGMDKGHLDMVQQWYSNEIEEYEFSSSKRFDFEDPNHGWKLHLNVSANNAREVSDFLKSNQYHHKFLSGGD